MAIDAEYAAMQAASSKLKQAASDMGGKGHPGSLRAGAMTAAFAAAGATLVGSTVDLAKVTSGAGEAVLKAKGVYESRDNAARDAFGGK